MNIRLGAYNNTLPPKITPLGIVYHANGLDDYTPNRVRKSGNKMANKGVEPYLVAQFKEWATRLPAELPEWIDAAYNERLADWMRCIGRQLPNGKTISFP